MVWAGYWLLITGSLLVVGSAILKWVQSPFSHNLPGLKISLLHDPGILPHITPFSVAFLGLGGPFLGILFPKMRTFVPSLASALLLTLLAGAQPQLGFRVCTSA